MADKTCEITGCTKPTRTLSAALCAMHYHRWYRHGHVERVATEVPSIRVRQGTPYRSTHRPDHPIAPPSGRVYVHRIVLYDSIGPGPHPCHWCLTPVDWTRGRGPGALYVDHLNDDGHDNRLENLVPSCGPCNITRGDQRRARFLREAGWWSNHDTVAITDGRRAPITAGQDAS